MLLHNACKNHKKYVRKIDENGPQMVLALLLTHEQCDVETRQMAAVEIGQMSAVETRQIYSIVTGQSPVSIVDTCLVSTCTSKDRKAR